MTTFGKKLTEKNLAMVSEWKSANILRKACRIVC